MQSRPCQAHTEPQRPSLPPLQAPTYALKVSVVRAKNLLAKDPNGERGAARSGTPGWGGALELRLRGWAGSGAPGRAGTEAPTTS